MVRSVSGLMALASVAGLLAGCTTTMQEAARLQLNSARIRVSEIGTRVTVAGHAVRVARVSLVSGARATAFVVVVHNASRTEVSDLPVSVGLWEGRGKRSYFNAQPGLEYAYFATHLPVLAPGTTLTWIFTSDRRAPRGARPFALVGETPTPSVRAARALPVIHASGGVANRDTVAVAVRNLSGIPQFQLPVFVFAKRGNRYVAAGSATVDQLDEGASTRLDLRLIGSVGHAQPEIEALPAVLQ